MAVLGQLSRYGNVYAGQTVPEMYIFGVYNLINKEIVGKKVVNSKNILVYDQTMTMLVAYPYTVEL